MGFDLHGLKPTTQKGDYFRNNLWRWHPLWGYVTHNCGDILTREQVEEGHWNDGIEIHAWQAELIANRLYDLLASGEPKEIENEIQERYQKFPEKQCGVCEGSEFMGENLTTCRACDGTGKQREISGNWYPFSEENVRESTDFCSHSGGFTIW